MNDIAGMFESSIAAKRASIGLAADIEGAAHLICQALIAGGKVLICGNGGSAADSEHFAAELLGRYKSERRSLPCVALTADSAALTAIANDYGYEHVFARQIDGLGSAGDVLIAISTSGNSENVVNAIAAAQAAGMSVIALTGGDGGSAAKLRPTIELRAAASVTANIQEVHGLILHCICATIDDMVSS